VSPGGAPGAGGKGGAKGDKPRLSVADFAASFQDAAVEILVEKTVTAAAAYKVRTVLLAGGVAANTRLRERLRERLGPDITLRYPPPILCTDNAAMVAAAAYFRYDAGLQQDWTLDIDPNAHYVE
jgi:N6-L-threonylcarbamoyladenine synthase